MKNLKDKRTNIFPSTTRGGKELPSSSALDSPSILSKLATPTPAIHSDMSHVIDDATSTLHDTYDESTSMLDNTVPVGEFLDEQLGRVRECWGTLQKTKSFLRFHQDPSRSSSSNE